MSAIKQYIDLYNEYSDTINSKSAAILNEWRTQAYSGLSDGAVTLPKRGDENYEITDMNAIFAPDYGVNINRIDMNRESIDRFRCDVPNMDALLYFLYNDTFMASNRTDCNLPEGVILTSLNVAANLYPELVKSYYAGLADISQADVALNTMLVQDGLFLYIPDGVVVERPIQLINILNSASPLMANRRLLVVVGKGAEAKMLVCDHTQNTDVDYLSTQVFEIFVGEDAKFDLYDIEEGSDTTNRVCSIYANQAKGSSLLINAITLTNGVTRNNINVKLSGEYAECKLQGLSISSKQQHIDNCTYISHETPNTRSSELFKYVLDDKAKGAFVGRVYVAEGAVKTEAYQSNKNLCVSNDAKVYTKPQLEIYADDVKCSHGATIGQLDQNALFYMQARGISECEARKLLMQAFMSDVIADVRMKPLRDRLRYLVERRFNGEHKLCTECSVSPSCKKLGK